MTAANDDTPPTTTELPSASINLRLASIFSYQRSEKPRKGGTGTSPSWNEYCTRIATGRKMNTIARVR